MSIGIEDADFNKYILVPFNLEVMKLSAYYKKRNEIVVLAPNFVPERHRLFFYRKDYNDDQFPLCLTRTSNVQYGGLAFSNNKYIPLDESIEEMHPDSSIYARAEQLIMKTNNVNRKKIYQNMIEAEHCRLSLDGKTIWQNFEKQFYFLPSARNLMIHDYDLANIKNSFETVKYILGKCRTDGWATKLGMKFPVIARDGQTLLNWSSLNSNSTFYSLRYEGVIDDDAFLEWVGHFRQKAIFSQIEYFVTPPWYEENHFLQVLLPKIYRQVIISRSFRIFFSLKYDEDFFSDKRWIQVMRLINFYMNSGANSKIGVYLRENPDDTMYEFVKACKNADLRKYADSMNIQEIRETFAFVREQNYELFKAFYECSTNSLEGQI